jgi:hypothetical protein
VILYWKALEPVERDYLSTTHLLGRQATSVGQVNRYPGGGMIPTSLWEPGQIWRDVYQINVSQDDLQHLAAARALAIKTYLLHKGGVEPERLFLTDETGTPLLEGSKVLLQLQ